jgi:hypothetical protein
MIYRIKKGKHWAWPLSLGLLINKTILTREICFDSRCKYELPDNGKHDQDKDQLDTNKLFGIGYFFSHHKHSARFGWRYDVEKGVFVISAYCYVNGNLIIRDIGNVIAERNYIFELKIEPGGYYFKVKDKTNSMVVASGEVFIQHPRKWGFPLGFYFGGNATAPHDMTIKIKKV